MLYDESALALATSVHCGVLDGGEIVNVAAGAERRQGYIVWMVMKLIYEQAWIWSW